MVERPLELRGPPGGRGRRARGHGAGRRGAGRPPVARPRRRRRHRHQRQDHLDLPHPGDPRGGRAALRADRHDRGAGRRRGRCRCGTRRPTPSSCRSCWRGCATPATRPARWRCRRTRSPSGGSAGTRFAAALFTNLTRDHLDYHDSVEDYYLAKRALFLRPAGEGDDPPGAANLDDELGRRLAREAGALGLRGRRPGAGAPDGVERAGDRHRRPASPRPAARSRSRAACAGASTSPTSPAPWPSASCWALPHEAVAAGIASVARRAGALRGGRGRPAVPGDRRLRPHARLGGERAAGGARAGRATGG